MIYQSLMRSYSEHYYLYGAIVVEYTSIIKIKISKKIV